LDALNPAVNSFGLDPYHPGGIDTVILECLRPYTLNGACGLFVDHVGHENKERQHGAIRKSQAVQGALYEAVKVISLKPGKTGRTRLVLRKDNRGSLGDMEGRTLAVAVMVSQVQPGDLSGRVETVFVEPDPFSDEAEHDGPMTPEQKAEHTKKRIIREMDRAGVPTDLSQQATREWMKDHEVEVPGRAVEWRAAHAERRNQVLGKPPEGME
jgi:hypothetical protein